MATFRCSKCLKKHQEDVMEQPIGYVESISECSAVGSGGSHNWMEISVGEYLSCRISILCLLLYIVSIYGLIPIKFVANLTHAHKICLCLSLSCPQPH